MSFIARITFASLVGVSSAANFLETLPDGRSSFVTTHDLEETLLTRLSQMTDSSMLLNVEEEMRPTFMALPKGKHGNLEPATVHFALHRYFVHKYGWCVKGLSPSDGMKSDGASMASVMKERAPAYIESLFNKRVHGHGLGLKELAAFAAALSDIVHKEAGSAMYRIFNALKLSTVDDVDRSMTDKAVKIYLVRYLMEADSYDVPVGMFEQMESDLVEVYPTWTDTVSWVEDFRQTHDLALKPSQNPFAIPTDNFDKTISFVQDVGHHFGQFQKLECAALKTRLVDMEHAGTGRVLLSQFYAGAVAGDWSLGESVDYLRNLGVLDETNPKRPSVVIPNYITSNTNCLTGSGFYSVCCSDECEGLLRHVEAAVAAPSGRPALIADVITNLPSDTVDAPRNLSTVLLSRLEDIAAVHGGSVPLHGRLFTQWMHHAYPRECGFPHVSGTVKPLTPDDWMKASGSKDVEASREELLSHTQNVDPLEIDGSEAVALPWTPEEELIAEHKEDIETSSSLPSLRGFMALAAVVSFAIPLFRASSTVIGGQCDQKADRFMV